jgi:hypothetical protein
MIKGDVKTIDVNVGQDNLKKNGVQILLNRHYNLEANYYQNKTSSYFSIHLTNNCMIPKPPLSEYFN